jgi:hypothetical protein
MFFCALLMLIVAFSFFFFIKQSPQKRLQRYRNYSLESLKEAIRLIDNGMSAYKASKVTGVPQSTIKDRRNGIVHKDSLKMGATALFTERQEQNLKEHAIEMVSLGYGYTRREFINLATDMAHYLKLLDEDKKLSEAWLYLGFLKRHENMTFKKPCSLSSQRAKSVTQEVIDNYFTNLTNIFTKYNFASMPQNIFNIDETGFSPEHMPPKVLTSKGVYL